MRRTSSEDVQRTIEGDAASLYQGIRPYLFAVAYRMTGSASDAEDLVQDAWIRYLAAGSPPVKSMRAYLTTIVSRLALDYLKSARVQREAYVGPWMPEPVLTADAVPGPAESAEVRESVSLALLTLLERLAPAQRVVYVLRHGFELPFDEIGAHIDRTAASCRQLFRRAEMQIEAPRASSTTPDNVHRSVIDHFLAALEIGSIDGVARLLASDAVWIGDGGGERLALRRPVTGRDAVSRGITGYADQRFVSQPLTHRILSINGVPAIVYLDAAGCIDSVTSLEIAHGQIMTIRGMRNPVKLRHLNRAITIHPSEA